MCEQHHLAEPKAHTKRREELKKQARAPSTNKGLLCCPENILLLVDLVLLAPLAFGSTPRASVARSGPSALRRLLPERCALGV